MKKVKLDNNIDSSTFKEYYYLKEELVDFCRKNKLSTAGSKIELTERIAVFLETGQRISSNQIARKSANVEEITLDTIIEENIVCSQKHRAFYKEQIGNHFSFNVLFQRWLKMNSGKTYRDSIAAYYQILNEKKTSDTIIDSQFEYNTYIRDFFKENKDKSLAEAIQCWKYKKSLKGHHRYENEDLKILAENR